MLDGENLDRFDLEQQILHTWGVTDEVKFLIELIEKNDETTLAYAKAIHALYEHKFNKLWEVFEDLVSSGRCT